MNKDDIVRQVAIIKQMLDSVSADETWRPDLPLVASKLRVLPKMVSRIIGGRDRHELSEALRGLRRRWCEIYFGEADEETSPTPPKTRRSRPSSRWDDREVTGFLKLMDDPLAMKIFCLFGRVAPESRSDDGRWVTRSVSKNPLACEAAALLEEYADLAWEIAEDAVLLAAEQGVRVTDLRSIAEAAAPSIHGLMVDDDPELLVWNVVGSLLQNGLLHTGVPANRPHERARASEFSLTEAGVVRVRRAISRWSSRASPAQKPDDSMPRPLPPIDDTPF